MWSRSLFFASLLAAGTTAQSPKLEQELATELRQHVRPFLKSWCGECHSGEDPEADFDILQRFRKLPKGDGLADVLAVRDALRDGDMPPEDEPQPPTATKRRVLAWAARMLASGRHATGPGRVTMRRLSRFEYRNTIRDLLSLPEAEVAEVAKSFPADDLGYGFDNNGDALTVSALHIEKYAAAARRFSALAIDTENPNAPARQRFNLTEHIGNQAHLRAYDDGAYFSSERTLSLPVKLPREGLYQIRITAWGQQAGGESAKARVGIGGRELAVFSVANTQKDPGEFVENATLPAGSHTFEIAFINDYYNPSDRKRGIRNVDRNLWVGSLEIVGPMDQRPKPLAQRWLFRKDRPRAKVRDRARPILRELLRRAWRRPPRTREVARLRDLIETTVKNGGSFESGLQLALQAALISPKFLFRVEPEARGGKTPSAELLGHYEIASRLSYFLWSSLPDEPLFRLAARKELHDPAILASQVRRMLRDPRAIALAENFAGQWLELRNLLDLTPDPKRFPTWSKDLRDAMRRETELFFHAILREERDVRELLDARFTFLNATLAKHYGIPGVTSPTFQRVALGDRRRGGLLGHASVLTVTSNPTRTSPVKRGKWVLENILDDPPPAPPPGNDNFPEGADLSTAHSLRKQLALHRRHKTCASCHNRMDALGLAMQNFDAIGRWRDRDGGQRIDASGELPGGRRIDGILDLKKVLRDDRAVHRCVAKKLFLYALGREVRGSDEVALAALVAQLPKRTTLTDMIVAIVQMDAFRRRSR